jgi:hypothetical protein
MYSAESLIETIASLCSDVPRLAHMWRFGLGAVYALSEGVHHHKERGEYTHADASGHVMQCADVAAQLRGGRPVDETWISGFLINSALMRIDAFYERSLRSLVPESQRDMPIVIPELRSTPVMKPHLLGQDKLAAVVDARFLSHTSFKRNKLRAVHEEVIRLKHDVEGQLVTGALTTSDATEALSEVLCLLRRTEILDFLKKQYTGSEPPP